MLHMLLYFLHSDLPKIFFLGIGDLEMLPSFETHHIYTIYPHLPNLINVTGIKSFQQLEIAKKTIRSKFEKKAVKVRIYNSFFFKEE